MKEYKVIIENNGTKSYYKPNTNILHNEDGPAIEYPIGYKAWYLNGKEITKSEFNNRNKVELTLDEIAEKFNINVNQLKIKK